MKRLFYNDLSEGQKVHLEYRSADDVLWYSGLAVIHFSEHGGLYASLCEPENKTFACCAWGVGFRNLNIDPGVHPVHMIK